MVSTDGHESEAIAGFVLGLISIVFSITIIIPILGIYFSSKGKNSSKASFAKAGKVLSILSLITPIILICLLLVPTITVIGMKIAGGNNTGTQAAIPMTEKYTASKEILDWYTSLGLIQTRIKEENPASVRVDVVLGYKKEDGAVSTEITQRTVEIKDFLRRYFEHKTAEELRPQNEEILKKEILNAINDTILTSSKIKDVRFMQMDVTQSK